MSRKLIICVVAVLFLLAPMTVLAQTQTGPNQSRGALSPGDSLNAQSQATVGPITNVNAPSQSIHNTNVVAPHQTQGQAQGQKQHQQQKQGQGQGQGQSLSNQPNQNIEGDETKIGIAPPAYAPGLVATPETCMGSSTAGVGAGSGLVGASVSFGTTWKSPECERRMNSKRLQELGLIDAAKAIMAQDPEVAKAIRASGVKASWLPDAPSVVAASASVQRLPGYTPPDGNFAARRDN